MNTKQVIIMRKDLNMRKGKMVAQGAHASMKAILDQGSIREYEQNTEYSIPLSLDMRDWLEGLFTKVCVGIESEEALRVIYDKAVDLGLPCSIIEDAGLTEFKGVPTITCAAIGPGDVDTINELCSHLKLL